MTVSLTLSSLEDWSCLSFAFAWIPNIHVGFYQQKCHKLSSIYIYTYIYIYIVSMRFIRYQLYLAKKLFKGIGCRIVQSTFSEANRFIFQEFLSYYPDVPCQP